MFIFGFVIAYKIFNIRHQTKIDFCYHSMSDFNINEARRNISIMDMISNDNKENALYLLSTIIETTARSISYKDVKTKKEQEFLEYLEREGLFKDDAKERIEKEQEFRKYWKQKSNNQ